MAIADKLTKLSTDITNAYEAIDDKGGTIPANKNTENLEDAIRSISSGGASEYNAKVVTTPISTSYTSYPSAMRFIKEFPAIDLTGFTGCQGFFMNCNNLEKVELFDTSNMTNIKQMFQYCSKLTSIPQFNTSKVTDMSTMFQSCTSLETVPILDTHLVAPYYMQNMFQGCPSLTNESLNNILYMAAHCSSGSAYRTLYNLGLSQAQATTCTGLSNWAAAQSAGWTTGY